ncbi:MAG: putative toxin-antitoxin system toxin component, PIN family [Lachnospiraceae bacterium]|nr:putative toxin-antitoxin system toxin component, PIN family [Lachnospiraceae bacterium]
MRYYAVIDTNVIIAALLSKNVDAATVKVLDAVFDGRIIPLYHRDILAEYDEVLHRKKFRLKEETIWIVLEAVRQHGVEVFPRPTGEVLIDQDDLVFYEVVMEKRKDNAYLVTGNQKHYPIREYIVTPAEMMEILEAGEDHSPPNRDLGSHDC